MKTNVPSQQPDSSFQAKAEKQASAGQIIQNYKQGTAQLQAIEKEEPIQQKENKTGLPDNLKSGVENLSGHSLDDVKVHYNSPQPASLQAHAYAQGTDIHVAPGQEKHLPHEAWHVVQQKQGRVQPTKQLKGKTNINDDAGLEKEADVMGAKAVQLASSSQAPSENKTLKAINSSPLIQRKQVHEATDYKNLSIHDTGETFSVTGAAQYTKDGAKWYGDNTLHAAANKTEAIGKIAKRAGDIGQSTQALGEKEIRKAGKREDANGIYAIQANYNKSDVKAIDPFTHGSYCQIGEDDYIVLMYQHTHDLDGYVNGMEEGKIEDGGTFKRTFAENMSHGGKKVVSSAADTKDSYDHQHNQTGGVVLNTLANSKEKGKADAITKLAGEGARFEWVRDNISTIKDNTLYTAPARDNKPNLSIRFGDLWSVWKKWFKGAYNIKNSEIDDVMYAKSDLEPVPKEAKKRILFNGAFLEE